MTSFLGLPTLRTTACFTPKTVRFGPPPKFLYLRVGSCSTRTIVELLRSSNVKLQAFAADAESGILIF